ncbi:endonuclease MutS2 [Clostridium septicum]|uniref:Endonuclease MutS2 n=1 Tax=Clostridium septicum TaxID=1504 RepID=A0A9N7JN75_CLOSE|nr:endonuclease MutS2 [Clostridium septicum]AYE35568.1 endonuclease MutS2 [Clostridium septicum]MDU1314990.1 endonuclease MutS2 [Clostridium septicum]QAS60954.1 endonuclease MutS2 [Clostridium septicum]UEC19769.1 endonuclease MutS2 [Clostridium septicum]USS02171.1 endonuclease MutS2 [Clostridium septicum]
MNDKSLRVLEFNKIKEKLKFYVVTSSGKEIVENLKPYNTAFEVRNKLKESSEALDILIRKGAPPFEGLFDVREALERAEKGGVLSPGQLLRIGGMFKCSRRFKEYISRSEEEISYPKLEDLAYILTPNKLLEDAIENAIISEDEISDKASSTLYNLRRNIKEKNSSVRDKINSIVRANAKYLQDSLYTMRGDRYVLPVKAEYKGAVQGLVHDQSSTGATLFIEPISLVNLNNEIRELKLKEQAEIERILMDLSERVLLNIEDAKSNGKILSELDFIFAKGKYASALNAICPEINENKDFDIIQGRHPLIDPKVVVPSDIYIGKDFNTLMITGPNTGGKTVTLKTVGLLHLMALSGLLIPAKDGSVIGFFTKIFADIGDEQSIEQSLSTFSSHMTNIVNIMQEIDENSLVLFDELGSGTDPVEGAGLAVAILDTLRNKGARQIATTHYSELKGYALKTPGIENASVEFDVETLRPTYRLLIGIPGKSNAFQISKRLGLREDVIEKAKNYISEENLQFEDLIRELQEKSIIANRDAREAKRIKNEAEEIKKKYNEKLKRLEEVRDKAYEDARRDAKNIISKAKDEADEILKAMRELEKLGIEQGGRKRLEEERRKLKEALEEREASLVKMRENQGESIEKVTLGMDAFLPSLNQKVVIVSMPDSKGEVQVEAGIMKINVKLKDLRKVNETPKKKEKKKREVKLNLKSIDSRIDLRGMDSEEACFRTDKYLDEAYMANLGEVVIVHGKGTGVLRKAINDMLKRHPHVKSYRLGVYGEGGDGVTIVTLK